MKYTLLVLTIALASLSACQTAKPAPQCAHTTSCKMPVQAHSDKCASCEAKKSS